MVCLAIVGNPGRSMPKDAMKCWQHLLCAHAAGWGWRSTRQNDGQPNAEDSKVQSVCGCGWVGKYRGMPYLLGTRDSGQRRAVFRVADDVDVTSVIPTECPVGGGGDMGYIWEALEKGYLEHLGSACRTDHAMGQFVRFSAFFCGSLQAPKTLPGVMPLTHGDFSPSCGNVALALTHPPQSIMARHEGRVRPSRWGLRRSAHCPDSGLQIRAYLIRGR